MATKTTTKKNRTRKTEERFRITPKGLFFVCLTDAFGVDVDDRRITVAWELFEARMKAHDYVESEGAK